MKMLPRFLLIVICLSLSLLAPIADQSFAACTPPAKIVGYSYAPASIQDAYDYASTTLNLTDFTLLLSGEIRSEDLFFNAGNVTLDGGYECSFTSKTQTATGIFGTVTVRSGAINFAGDVKIVSTNLCTFDADDDGYSSIGSCGGTADDCNDNDANINPGVAEICDGIDNNCNGQIDEGALIDGDGDGYYELASCSGSPYANDCNDADATINPGAIDISYDGIDQDCSGADLTYEAETACTFCHNHDPTTWDSLHSQVTAPDTSCASCHAPEVANILPGHYGNTVLTADNNMNVGDTIVCVSCHDLDAATHSFGGAIGTGTNYVWGKVMPVRGNVNCDTCHENRATAHQSATAHDNREIDTTCGACHTSDTTVLGIPGTGTLASDADVDTLHRSDCALCHAYSGTLLNAAIVRQTIEQGVSGTPVSCLACHSDQATDHGDHTHTIVVGPDDLSYDPPGQLCSACHLVSSWVEIEAKHDVVTNGTGSCATCHNSPRQEVINSIDAGADPTHCLSCHPDKELTVHGDADHVALEYVTGGITYCLNCHDTGAPENGTVVTTHMNQCSLCHTSVPDLQSGVPLGGGDCTTCHTNTWELLHITNPPDHSSLVQVDASVCAACHSDPPPLIDPADPKVHNGCASCHDDEGGLISYAINHDFDTGGDCTSCHTGNWSETHTVAPNHGMIVTVSGTSCANCHDDTLVSTATTTHNACTSCHDAETGALISLAAGQSAPGDCTSCHGNDWATSHTIDCLSCHDQAQDNLDNLPVGGRRAVAGEFPSGTNHAHLADSAAINNSDCQTCHSLIDHTDGTVKLLDADTGALYQFAKVADLTSDPDISDFCMSCHDQDGATRLTAPLNPFGNGNSPNDTASRFLGTLEWNEYYGDICFGWEGSQRFVNSHHDLSDADQANSGAKLECLNCHAAHSAADTQILVDPFDPLAPWTGVMNDFCQACHNGGTDVTNVALPDGVVMGKIAADIDGDEVPEQVSALGGMDSCSYGTNPWYIDIRIPSSAHMAGSKRGWVGYSGAPAYDMECTACHDPHGSYSANNPAGNPYAIRDMVDGTPYIDDGARTQGFNGPPWTIYGVNQEVILTPNLTPGAENLDLRNLCVTCHSDWSAAYSWHAFDCTGCLTCHSHGAAWDSNDWGDPPDDTPWCP